MEEKKRQTNGKIWIGGAVLAAAIVLFAAVFLLFGAKPEAGSKKIVIEVVDSGQQTESYELRTDAEFLRQAMEEAEGLTFAGNEGPYGMMVESVNGETAVYDKDNAYWSFYVNGEYCSYGIDTQPVKDGDCFRIVYTINAQN